VPMRVASFDHGADHFGMLAHAEIIVDLRAEGDYHHFSNTAFGGDEPRELFHRRIGIA
jgi:hypothetical protein